MRHLVLSIESLVMSVDGSVTRADQSLRGVWVKLAVVAVIVGLVLVAMAADLHID
jgi:hypothetical protein